MGTLRTTYPTLMKIMYYLQSQEGKERTQELEKPSLKAGGSLFFHTTSYSISSQRRSKEGDVSNTGKFISL